MPNYRSFHDKVKMILESDADKTTKLNMINGLFGDMSRQRIRELCYYVDFVTKKRIVLHMCGNSPYGYEVVSSKNYKSGRYTLCPECNEKFPAVEGLNNIIDQGRIDEIKEEDGG